MTSRSLKRQAEEVAMTKKHFTAIAAMFRAHMERNPGVDILPMVDEFVTIAKQDNPNFNRARFIDACCLEDVL